MADDAPDVPESIRGLPELDPSKWPDDAVVTERDVPPFDPDEQALLIRSWEPLEDADGVRPEFFTLPREVWAREAAYQDGARQVLERLDERFDEGYRVWTVPPDPDDPDDVGEVVVGVLLTDTGDTVIDVREVRAVVPDTVDGTAAGGTPHEYTASEIPVVIERTKDT